MYALHIANKNYSSWSLRPWVLMRELGIGFEEALHPFSQTGSSYETFSRFSPSGLVPVLVDGDLAVWESLAIAEYLGERHPAVWPEDPAARAWARSAAAEIHAGFSTLRNVCGMNCGVRVRLRNFPDGLRRDLERIEALWGDGLARFGGPFLAGESFSAVDAFYCPVAFRVQTYGLPLGDLARAYVDRLLGLGSMRDWYAAALAETFRDQPHEEEVRSAGEVTADLRAAAV